MPTNMAAIDTILAAYINIADSALKLISSDVFFVFTSLAVIGMSWAHLRNALVQREHPLGLLLMQLMTVGFFVWLLRDWGALTKALASGMIQLGLKAGGSQMPQTDFAHPSKIAALGVTTITPLMDAFSIWGSGFNNFIFVCAALVIVFAFCIMSLQVFMAILEFKLGVIWCFLMIAMGVFRGTAFASEKALGYVFASGIKLFALATVVSVGFTLLNGLFLFSDPPRYNEAIAIAFASMTVAMLAWFAPAKVAGVVSGGPSLGAGAMLGTAAALAAAAGMATYGAGAAARAATGTSLLRDAAGGSGAVRGAAGGGGASPIPPAGGGGGGMQAAANSNPVASVRAFEGINAIEQKASAARGRGVSNEAVQSMRANDYRALAMESAASASLKNPEVGERAATAIAEADNARTFGKSDGLSKEQSSERAAEAYKHAAIRTLNLDGAGGFERPELATGATPEAGKQNAALAESLGVGGDIRSMAAQGMSTRQIADGLGEKLSPVNKMAERIGQGSDAHMHRMSVVQAYKDENGIPNHNSAGFGQWQKAEQAKQSATSSSSASSAPSWAQGAKFNKPAGLRMPANINSLVPRGSDRSGGMNASNTGASE